MVFITGNLIHFLDIPTKTITFRRTANGAGISCIAVSVFRHLLSAPRLYYLEYCAEPENSELRTFRTSPKNRTPNSTHCYLILSELFWKIKVENQWKTIEKTINFTSKKFRKVRPNLDPNSKLSEQRVRSPKPNSELCSAQH